MLEFNAGVSGGSSGWGGGGAQQEEGCAQLLSEHLFGQKKKKKCLLFKASIPAVFISGAAVLSASPPACLYVTITP